MKKGFYILFLLSALLLQSCERPSDTGSGPDGIPPAVPAGLKVYLASDGEIIIDWNRNTEPDLAGYNVYRSMDNKNFSKIYFTGNDYYSDDSLDYNKRYIYRITAVDGDGGESNPTDTVSAVPLNKYKPAVPMGIEINARNWVGKRSVFIMWAANPESDIAGYNIYRGTAEGFAADSVSFFAFTPEVSFNDTSADDLYREYYYKVKAVDKGKLISDESGEVSDQIFDIPGVIYPVNNSYTGYFSYFKIKTINKPAVYKIILQSNEYFGEIWSTEINSALVNDTLDIAFNYPYLDKGVKYYWRVLTYSGGSDANSISPLYNFTIKEN